MTKVRSASFHSSLEHSSRCWRFMVETLRPGRTQLGEHGVGLYDGGGVVVGVVVAFPVLGAAVVGVIVGGASTKPEALGGGSVGLIKLEPNILTNVCWVAGWSTVSTSP